MYSRERYRAELAYVDLLLKYCKMATNYDIQFMTTRCDSAIVPMVVELGAVINAYPRQILLDLCASISSIVPPMLSAISSQIF